MMKVRRGRDENRNHMRTQKGLMFQISSMTPREPLRPLWLKFLTLCV